MVTHQLHGSLLVPGVGRQVVGWLGWAMFASSATGLWLWWPRHAGFAAGLRWRRGASTLFNLHHTIGFWLCLPLAVLSLTGVYIAFPQASHALFGVPAPPARPAGPGRFPPPLAQPMISLETAVAAALADRPGATVASVSTPTRGKDPTWRVQLKTPGAMEPVAVQVADATGQIKPGKGGGRGAGGGEGGPDPLSAWMRRIHDGAGMGIVWRTIITVAGIAPAVLGVTGLVMWLRRRARQRAVRRA
ncbi:MAG: PepSY protein [Phenylobacterium sp.]|nr:PepSY protein [Phenylobacterium sp.]